MGDPKTTFWQQVEQSAPKWMVWIGYITAGVAAKIAFDSRTNQLTWKAIAIKAVLSIFVGFMSCVACDSVGHSNWIKLVAPVSTLLGEALIVWAMTNWYDVLSRFFPKIFPKKKS